MKTKFKQWARQLVARIQWQWCLWQAARRVRAVKLQYPQCESAMNAWPETGASGSTGYAAQGVTTIRWGTGSASHGLLQSPKPTGGFYTVLRFNQKSIVDNVKLPNGNGVTATRVQIIDGQQYDLTVRDDTNMTPPQVGDAVTVIDAGGLIDGTTAGSVKGYAATVVESGWDSAPKQAGERTITVENLLLVESQTGATQVAA